MAPKSSTKSKVGSPPSIGLDAMLTATGWTVQDDKAFAPAAFIGITLREVPLKSDRCDYLLQLIRKPVGFVEAKNEGTTLSTLDDKWAHYAANLPNFLPECLGSDSLPFRHDSTASDYPRSLIQMATVSGKTFNACAFTYRLIKFAKTKRVPFLMNRVNLGRQAKTEFDQYVRTDDVRHLTSNKLDDVCRVNEASDKVEKGFYVDRRHKETYRRRWERLDEDLAFTEKEQDRPDENPLMQWLGKTKSCDLALAF